MRARERHRAARKIREVCEHASPKVAGKLAIVWARDMVDSATLIDDRTHGMMVLCDPGFTLVLCETRWQSQDESGRADTVAHELAHATSGDHGHGRRWKREHKRILEIAEGIDWT